MDEEKVILKDEDKVSVLELNNKILNLQVNIRELIIQEKRLQDALDALIKNLAKKYKRDNGYVLNSEYEFVKSEVPE